MRTTRELFEYLLQDLYSTELVQLAFLQQMARESTLAPVKQLFIDHHEQTQYQIVRLEQVFGMLGKAPGQGQCATLDGLIEEKQAFGRRRPAQALLDSYNLIAGVKSERLEISVYEGLIARGEELDMARIVPHLQANLREEREALGRLTAMSEARRDEGRRGEDSPAAATRSDYRRVAAGKGPLGEQL
jgi:ferritin-like metal-binding protein YciE